MARRVIQGLPSLPTEGVPQAQLVFFNALKEVIEKLIGLKGDPKLTAVVRGDVTINVPGPRITNLTASGQAFNLGGVNLASGADVNALINDVQQMLLDNIELRQTVVLLVKQMKEGGS